MEAIEFEAVVRADAPYFKQLDPILKSMGFTIAAYFGPRELHGLDHTLKNEIHSDCTLCMDELAERSRHEDR